jgi:hypothetical protein
MLAFPAMLRTEIEPLQAKKTMLADLIVAPRPIAAAACQRSHSRQPLSYGPYVLL